MEVFSYGKPLQAKTHQKKLSRRVSAHNQRQTYLQMPKMRQDTPDEHLLDWINNAKNILPILQALRSQQSGR